MNNKFPELEKALKSSEVIELPQPGSKKYKFRTFSFGERGTELPFKLLNEIKEGLCDSIKQNFSDFDYIVAPEPGGHTWAFVIAIKLKKKVHILRYQPSYASGEIEVRRKTGYYQHNLYFNNFKKGDRILIIDDIISTGGTLHTIISTLKKIGVIPVGVQVIYAKSDDYKMIEKKYLIPVKFLMK